jgi:hypothetical protein
MHPQADEGPDFDLFRPANAVRFDLDGPPGMSAARAPGRGRTRALQALLVVASVALAVTLGDLREASNRVAQYFAVPDVPQPTVPTAALSVPAVPVAPVVDIPAASTTAAPAPSSTDDVVTIRPTASVESDPPAEAPPANEPDRQVPRPLSPPLSQLAAARLPPPPMAPASVPAPVTASRDVAVSAVRVPAASSDRVTAATTTSSAGASAPASSPLAASPAPVRDDAGSAAEPVSARAARTDEMDVQAVLRRYERAYGQLDARAAQAVWPSVDVGDLARAFRGLESQALEFDRCDLDVQGTVASADCRGRATYVRRVGSKAPRTEARAWSFRLRKVDDNWQILRVDLR